VQRSAVTITQIVVLQQAAASLSGSRIGCDAIR